MPTLRLPLATYRLQFNYQFTFQDALTAIDYFHALGISDLYVSPITRAHARSLHGYDVIDYNTLNPELGTEDDFKQLIAALKAKGMGLILDFVPNHMWIADPLNHWWNDVLENGPSSIYSHYFNIVWNPPKAELKNKVLLPVLDRQYGQVIEEGELQVGYADGAFFVDFKDRHFPLDPQTWLIFLHPIAQRLEAIQGESHPATLELESILTALENLPKTTETESDKCKVRHRETEIIKQRFNKCVKNSPVLAEVIQKELVNLNGQKGDPRSFDRLENLLSAQCYRLSYWRVTNDEINYHRFFDINELVSMRVEAQDVFTAMHQLLFKYIAEQWITGLRIDHVDGLLEPENYLKQLQQQIISLLGEKSATNQHPFYIIVEKILIGPETLPLTWPVFGTTGYDFLNLVNGLFVKPESRQVIHRLYRDFIGHHEEMASVMYACKKLILLVSMSSELHILARHLEEICEQHRWSRDFTLEGLRAALRDVIACFPVYRSYIRAQENQVSEEDRHTIEQAIVSAKRANPASDASIFDFIQHVLLLQDPSELTKEQIDHRRHFVMRFQQLTGPVTAKGVEDTAFYRVYPLASLNEVGMDPTSFGVHVDYFHRQNLERLKKSPHTLLATFTHDTKRSEDVRARLNVLSENPQSWHDALHRWSELNQCHKVLIDKYEVPDRNEEYLLYQTLIGTWPFYSMDAAAHLQYVERIEKYMTKALKESKIHTSWINPNEAYENGVSTFIKRLLTFSSDNSFIKDLSAYVSPIAKAGIYNSLSQLVLKVTVPGIPDFYQGSELWSLTLVDPDNRQRVDYEKRTQFLRELQNHPERELEGLVDHLLDNPEDGRIKLYLTQRLLNCRQRCLDLFSKGDYVALHINGPRADNVVAFSRQYQEEQIIVVVGRFYTQVIDIARHKPVKEAWKDTYLCFTEPLTGHYQDVFTGLKIHADAWSSCELSFLLHTLPLLVLEKM